MDANRENIIYDILLLIRELHGKGSNNHIKGTMFLHCDAQKEDSVLHLEGDLKMQFQLFVHMLTSNNSFKQLIMASFASFLINNPNVKDEFIKGLEIMKDSPSIN